VAYSTVENGDIMLAARALTLIAPGKLQDMFFNFIGYTLNCFLIAQTHLEKDRSSFQDPVRKLIGVIQGLNGGSK